MNKKYLPLVAVAAFALTAFGAGTAPAFAVDNQSGDSPAAQSSQPLYMDHGESGGAARGEAVHDCSVQAGKWSSSAWQSMQIQTYGNCMAEHGQPQ